MTGTAPGNLDMNVAEQDEFSPDKLRATVERLYMTVVCIYTLKGSSFQLITIDHWSIRLRQANSPPAIVARKAENHGLLCGISHYELPL